MSRQHSLKPNLIPESEKKKTPETTEQNSTSEEEENFPMTPSFKERRPTIQRQKSFYQVLQIKENHSQFRKAIPKMNICLAVILCICNFIFPGLGTLLSTFAICAGCKTEYGTDRASPVKYNIAAAIFQLILTPLLFLGYLWSIYWGVLFCIISCQKDEANKQPEVKHTKVLEPAD